MRTISYSVYDEGIKHLDEAQSAKASAEFWADIYSPFFEEHAGENAELLKALGSVREGARHLEKALIGLLAVYERKEMADYPENWEFADRRRSA